MHKSVRWFFKSNTAYNVRYQVSSNRWTKKTCTLDSVIHRTKFKCSPPKTNGNIPTLRYTQWQTHTTSTIKFADFSFKVIGWWVASHRHVHMCESTCSITCVGQPQLSDGWPHATWLQHISKYREMPSIGRSMLCDRQWSMSSMLPQIKLDIGEHDTQDTYVTPSK